MSEEILFEKYFTLALRYLTRRPRSEKELRDYLTKKIRNKKNATTEDTVMQTANTDSGSVKTEVARESVIDRIISVLKEQKFLNDEEFARWFIEQRKRFRKKSDRLIRLELRQKGIDNEMFEKVDENMENKKTDEQTAQELVERKIGIYKHLPRQEIYQKLGAFLARRGFDWDVIKTAIDEKLKKGV